MESSKHRRNARVVGYVDLVLTVMMLWIPIVMFIAAVALTAMATNPNLQQDVVKEMNEQQQNSGGEVQDATTAAIIIVWILFAIMVLFIGIQITAAVKLINATQIGKQPGEAARLARCWRLVTWIFTVCSILSAIFQPLTTLTLITYIVEIVLRFVALYIVQQFIAEADTVVLHTLPTTRSTSSANPYKM